MSQKVPQNNSPRWLPWVGPCLVSSLVFALLTVAQLFSVALSIWLAIAIAIGGMAFLRFR